MTMYDDPRRTTTAFDNGMGLGVRAEAVAVMEFGGAVLNEDLAECLLLPVGHTFTASCESHSHLCSIARRY
jgi:hypothetical protein